MHLFKYLKLELLDMAIEVNEVVRAMWHTGTNDWTMISNNLTLERGRCEDCCECVREGRHVSLGLDRVFTLSELRCYTGVSDWFL